MITLNMNILNVTLITQCHGGGGWLRITLNMYILNIALVTQCLFTQLSIFFLISGSHNKIQGMV